jgi:modulator of FtsH protease
LGAVSIVADAGGGLYWIAAGIVLATAGAVLNAWVLLVEILR